MMKPISFRTVVPKSLLIFLVFFLLLAGCAIYGRLTSQVNGERFKETIAGMNNMVAMSGDGNLKKGEKSFNQVHGFFHDLDPVLRKENPALAKELWGTVLQIEIQYGVYRPDQEKLIYYGTKTIHLLQEARKRLR